MVENSTERDCFQCFFYRQFDQPRNEPDFSRDNNINVFLTFEKFN